MNLPVIIIAGIVVGIGGYLALRRFESLRGKSTDELRAILHSPDWLFYRNALIELDRRGEDIRQEVMPILDLLISDTRQQRIAGWYTLRELYPELASRVPDYKPEESSDVCKEQMQKLLLHSG
jgi:hypothetical protein